MIRITTSGILLKNQTDEFWDCCRTNNIIITISVYPVNVDYDFIIITIYVYLVNVDYDFIINKAGAHNVQIQFRGDVKIVSKNWEGTTA
jgi:hypothetical protein